MCDIQVDMNISFPDIAETIWQYVVVPDISLFLLFKFWVMHYTGAGAMWSNTSLFDLYKLFAPSVVWVIQTTYFFKFV